VTTLAEAFEAECRQKVGSTHTLAMPQRDPAYADFVELFPETKEGRQLAMKAAGYKPGSTAYRSYYQRLRRYNPVSKEAVSRGRPKKLDQKSSSIVRAQWRRNARPHTVRKVLELINKWGATVYDLELAFAYDGDGRMRNLSHWAVGITPPLMQQSGFIMPMIRQEPIPWENLARSFLLAYGRAYGMGDFGVAGSDDVISLGFRIGFTGRAQYQFGVRSRPAGAQRATGNKYRGLRAS
jgi:hypothetical protein